MSSHARIGGLVAALLGGLVYLNALDNPFVYDDHRTVLDNGSIRSLVTPRAIVLHDITRPLVNLSYAVDRAMWGEGPFGFHLTNVILHMVNVVLLFLIVWRLASDRRTRQAEEAASASPPVVAFAAAALFAVHPMMTEAVGYISGRTDVLHTMLFFLGFLCGRRWMQQGGARWWLLALGLWVAAVLAKESALMLPAALFLYDRIVLERGAADRRRSFWILHVPLLGLALAAGAVLLIVFYYVERAGVASIAWWALLGQAGVIWRYAGLLVFPAGQTIFHDVQPVRSLIERHALVDAVALAGLVAVVVLAWRTSGIHALVRFGVLWFVLLLLPSAVLALIDWAEPMAEHRAYLASCGLFLAAAAGVGWLEARLSTISVPLGLAGRAAFAVILLSLGARTLLRNAVWADPVTLWREAVMKAPTHWLPQTVLGESLHAAGRHQEAVAAFRTALALNPADEMSYLKLAVCLSELGRSSEAAAVIETLERADPRSPLVSTGLGAVAMLAGDTDRARRYFLATLDHDPRNVMALQWLAVLEEKAAQPAEALRRCQELERVIPGRSSTEDCISRNQPRTR